MKVEEFYESARKFNSIAGNLDVVDFESINNQLSFLFSELTEAIDGFEQKNPKELLDGALDVGFVWAGLMQKLERAGFDVAESMKRVAENNLTKFPKNLADENGKRIQPDGTVAHFKPMHNCFVFKNMNDKVMKPLNYKEVNLDGTYDEDFFLGYGDLK